MHRRLAAIMQAFDVSWDDLKDETGDTMLFLGSGVDAPLMIAQRRGDGVAIGRDVRAFTTAVRDGAIDTVILDPLVELHQASENDNVEMRQVLGVVRQIAKAANCAALVVTHVKKPDKARTDGFAGDMDSARGASLHKAASAVSASRSTMRKKATISTGNLKDRLRTTSGSTSAKTTSAPEAKCRCGSKSKKL